MPKKDSDNSLTITNAKIIEFFKKHKSINHEHFILFFIEHLDKMFDSMTGDVNASMVTNALQQLQQSFTSLSLRVSENRDKFTDDVKMIVSANNSENIEPLIREQFQLSQKTNSSDNSLTRELSSTEQRLDARISEVRNNCDGIKTLITSHNSDTTSLNDAVLNVLKKMENSSEKGKISENILVNILQPLYPCSQINHVGQQKETGDVILIRNNRPKILIENKNWNRNVTQDEVKKFIHDVEAQNCCGLFLSQNCGIANKDNFEINIHDSNVLLYIHTVNNDPEKIKVAIDIIDYFKSQLDDLENTSETDTIPKEKLDAINVQFQAFAQSKLSLIKLAKDFNQKLIKQVDELKIPSLEEFLSTKYASSANKVVCDYCERGFKNKASLASHLKGCGEKKAKENGAPTIIQIPN
jgi:hypothetical protein